ncbi:MAG: lipid biosynthesis protein [Verrucomicrobiales bacterium]|jgi:lipid-A-disaccharide synthase-like uncharacterized protein|nr:lipid biosynthesis protein [Verrucomicrobiales bacterium]
MENLHSSAGTFLEPFLAPYAPWLFVSSIWWTVIGFAGNLMFGSRFIFQWLASERKHCLVVPGHFWYLSFVGSVLNLLYSFHLDNAPLILGVIALPFIYGRNIVLMKRERPQREPRERDESAPMNAKYRPA